MKKKLKTTALQITSRSWEQKKPKPHFSCCCKKNHKLVMGARTNEGKIPPTSRLQTSWLVCCSTERKTHKEKRERRSKAGKLKSKVDKRKRGEEEDRRPGRYIEGFQSSEPRPKR